MSQICSTGCPSTSFEIALRLPLQPPVNSTCSMVLPVSSSSTWMFLAHTPRGVKSVSITVPPHLVAHHYILVRVQSGFPHGNLDRRCVATLWHPTHLCLCSSSVPQRPKTARILSCFLALRVRSRNVGKEHQPRHPGTPQSLQQPANKKRDDPKAAPLAAGFLLPGATQQPGSFSASSSRRARRPAGHRPDPASSSPRAGCPRPPRRQPGGNRRR